jgi:hypothetical protein
MGVHGLIPSNEPVTADHRSPQIYYARKRRSENGRHWCSNERPGMNSDDRATRDHIQHHYQLWHRSRRPVPDSRMLQQY